MHHDGVVVGGVGDDRFVMNKEYRANAVGHFWIVNHAHREQDVARGEWLTVEPFHVMAEMKGYRLVVGRNLPFLSKPRFWQGRNRIQPGKTLEQIAGELSRGRVGDQNRIEGAGVAGTCDVEDLTRRVIVRGPTKPASGKQRVRFGD